MNAHDVRHLTLCGDCRGLGDARRMPRVADVPYHGACLVARFPRRVLLALPPAETSKLTLGECGPDLARELLAAAERRITERAAS